MKKRSDRHTRCRSLRFIERPNWTESSTQRRYSKSVTANFPSPLGRSRDQLQQPYWADYLGGRHLPFFHRQPMALQTFLASFPGLAPGFGPGLGAGLFGLTHLLPVHVQPFLRHYSPGSTGARHLPRTQRQPLALQSYFGSFGWTHVLPFQVQPFLRQSSPGSRGGRHWPRTHRQPFFRHSSFGD